MAISLFVATFRLNLSSLLLLHILIVLFCCCLCTVKVRSHSMQYVAVFSLQRDAPCHRTSHNTLSKLGVFARRCPSCVNTPSLFSVRISVAMCIAGRQCVSPDVDVLRRTASSVNEF